MKLFKDWTNFEKLLLFGSIVIVSVVGICFKSDLLTVSCSSWNNYCITIS